MKKVRIIAPSSPQVNHDMSGIENAFAEMDCIADFASHALDAERFLAGSDKDRAQDVMDAFEDTTVDVIAALRGGYGSARILDKLNYKQMARNAKPFFGFSDTTSLQLAMWSQCGMVTYSGFMAGFFVRDNKTTMMKEFQNILNKKPIKIDKLKMVAPGKVTGTIVGGTLSMVVGLVGTKYMPDLRGAILFLEDLKEEPYHVDRMLNQLRLAGCFDQLGGVILGEFYECIAKDPSDGTVDQVLDDYFGKMRIPVVKNFKYTHHNNTVIVPIGAEAELDANKGTLVIDEY